MAKVSSCPFGLISEPSIQEPLERMTPFLFSLQMLYLLCLD